MNWFSGFDPQECKIQCMQGANRIKLNSNKTIAQLQAEKAKVAEYFRAGNYDLGMIRTESVLNIERSREALMKIEVYLGLVQQRVEQIKRDKQLPPELRTAITSIVYAANRVESLPELRALRKIFERKYGRKELAMAAGEVEDVDPTAAGVAANLIACVSPAPPLPADWVAKGLAIAEEQGIEGVEAAQLYEGIQVAMPVKPRAPGGGSPGGVPQVFSEPGAPAPVRVAPPSGGFIADPVPVNDMGNPNPSHLVATPTSPPVQHFGSAAAQQPPPAAAPFSSPPQLPSISTRPAAAAAPAAGGWVTPPAHAQPATAFQEGPPPAQRDDTTTPGEVEGYLEAMHKAQSEGAAQQPLAPYLDSGNPDRGGESYAGMGVPSREPTPHNSLPAPPPGAYKDGVEGESTYPEPTFLDKPPESAFPTPPAPPAQRQGGEKPPTLQSWDDLPPPPSTDPANALPDPPKGPADLPSAPRFSHSGVLFTAPISPKKGDNDALPATSGAADAAGPEDDLMARLRKLQQ